MRSLNKIKRAVVHMAQMVSEHGDISPVCAGTNPVIVSVQAWTLQPSRVTCQKCKLILRKENRL